MIQHSIPEGEEFLTVSIRYKDPEGEKSMLKEFPVTADNEYIALPDNLSWAAGVAQVGMLLRESEYAGSSTYDEVHGRLENQTQGDEFREEFVYLINRFKGAHLEDTSDYGGAYVEDGIDW